MGRVLPYEGGQGGFGLARVVEALDFDDTREACNGDFSTSPARGHGSSSSSWGDSAVFRPDEDGGS